jgi:hypothetical protein
VSSAISAGSSLSMQFSTSKFLRSSSLTSMDGRSAGGSMLR